MKLCQDHCTAVRTFTVKYVAMPQPVLPLPFITHGGYRSAWYSVCSGALSSRYNCILCTRCALWWYRPVEALLVSWFYMRLLVLLQVGLRAVSCSPGKAALYCHQSSLSLNFWRIIVMRFMLQCGWAASLWCSHLQTYSIRGCVLAMWYEQYKFTLP